MQFEFNNNSGCLGSFLNNLSPAVKNILIINVILFIATLINEDVVSRWLALWPTNGTYMYFNHHRYMVADFFYPWQIVTYMFVHGGWLHIFFNMYTMVIFGPAIERTIGTRKFLLVYFISGIGAALLQIGVERLTGIGAPTVGASGAIYGLLVAYAMLFPHSRMQLLFPPVSMEARWFVLIFAGIELLFGITGTMSDIAHFAHVGGALFAFALMFYWKKSGKLWN